MKGRVTNIPGVLRFQLDFHQDKRGGFAETFSVNSHKNAGIPEEFVQDMYSQSRRRVLRGLHYQITRPQGHLVTVVSGQIFDVGVDLRPSSSSFGEYFSSLLDGEKLDQVYLPPGIAHGFCVLSNSAQIFYKCTEFYLPGDEGGLLWNDPDLGIKWPIVDPYVTARDTKWPCLKDLSEDHLPRL